MKTLMVIVSLGLICGATNVSAELYKCVQQSGKLVFQDKPCPASTKTVYSDQTPFRQMSPEELKEHKAAVDKLELERAKRKFLEEQKQQQAKQEQEKALQEKRMREIAREESEKNSPAPVYMYSPPPPQPINCYTQGGNVYCN